MDYWWDGPAEFLIMKIFMPLMLALLAALLFIGIPLGAYALYEDAKAPKITLNANDWSCVQEQVYTTTTMVMSGKVMVPVTTTHHDCINYVHK